MKRRAWFSVFLILLVLSAFAYLQITDSSIFKKKSEKVTATGETVTGEAANANLAITITLIGSPTIEILKPENETYFSNIDLDLWFSSGGADFIWYNLDNGANTTITGNATFNTTSGQHTLYLFANNSNSSVSKNVTFTVNLTKFTIIHNNYKNNGSSTDFNKSSFEDIQNLSGVVLERSEHGRINFNEAINLTNDADVSDNILDLDSYTNISPNLIEISTTALPNFNKSATLYLYNLSFTNPRVLRDGSPCASTICTEISYSPSTGIFIFNVTQFTNYSAEETPSGEEVGEEQLSGGGGGGGIPAFTLDKDQISVSLTPGQVKLEYLIITNTRKSTIDIKIDNLIPEFVIGGEDVISLGPGESKAVPFYVIARVDAIPDLYLGKIILSSGSIKREILIAVEVESEGALLDVRAEIESKYKKVLPGEYILAQIKLFNLGGEGRKDIDMEYIIRDYNGDEIIKETESLAIETQITFLKKISIPENVPLGSYVLYVRAIYGNKIASASDNFEIVKTAPFFTPKNILTGLVIVILVIAILIILRLLRKRGRKEKGRGFKDYKGEVKERIKKKYKY